MTGVQTCALPIWTYTLNDAGPDTAGLAAGQTAEETYTYTAQDEAGATATATLTVTVTGPDPNNNNHDEMNGDTVVSGSKNDGDSIQGSIAGDTLQGGAHSDTIYGAAGNDSIDGGSNGDDLIFAGSGDDTVSGGNQNDTIYGGSGNDALSGGGNDDWLFGGSGADILLGENNNDTLVGGYGADTLTGGSNADAFEYLSQLDIGDLITDFVSGTDGLYLSQSAFNALVWNGNDLDANDLLSGAGLSSSNTGAHLVYDTSSGKLYYDADASGAGSGVMIAQFGTVTHPTL